MTPEGTAGLVARWVRFCTRNLPGPIAQRRIDEIDADLHDHTAHERSLGTGDRRIALGILSRMARGVAADASWRRRAIAQHQQKDRLVKPLLVILAILAIALGIAAFVFGESDDSPGLQLIGVLLVAGPLFLGVRTARRSR